MHMCMYHVVVVWFESIWPLSMQFKLHSDYKYRRSHHNCIALVALNRRSDFVQPSVNAFKICSATVKKTKFTQIRLYIGQTSMEVNLFQQAWTMGQVWKSELYCSALNLIACEQQVRNGYMYSLTGHCHCRPSLSERNEENLYHTTSYNYLLIVVKINYAGHRYCTSERQSVK